MHLGKCYLLHNLYIMQKAIHWRNRKRTSRPIPKTPTRCEKDDNDASKPVARILILILKLQRVLQFSNNLNLPIHSKEHMSISCLSLHQGTTDSRKNIEQRFIFQIGALNPHGITATNAFHSINLFQFFTSPSSDQ